VFCCVTRLLARRRAERIARFAVQSVVGKRAAGPAAVELGRLVRKIYSSFLELVKRLDDHRLTAEPRGLGSMKNATFGAASGMAERGAPSAGNIAPEKQDGAPA
jgi:hypothetical protein